MCLSGIDRLVDQSIGWLIVFGTSVCRKMLGCCILIGTPDRNRSLLNSYIYGVTNPVGPGCSALRAG